MCVVGNLDTKWNVCVKVAFYVVYLPCDHVYMCVVGFILIVGVVESMWLSLVDVVLILIGHFIASLSWKLLYKEERKIQ